MSYLKISFFIGALSVLVVASDARADTVYTWRDSDGGIHLGTRRPVSSHQLMDINASSSAGPGRSSVSSTPGKSTAKPAGPQLDPVLKKVKTDAEAANQKVLSTKAIFEKARKAFDDFKERAQRNRNFKRRKRSVMESLREQAELAYDEYRQAVDRANELYRRAEKLKKETEKPAPATR